MGSKNIMRIAIVGLGRVGSATAFCLAGNKDISELILIDKKIKNAAGLKADLVGTFPNYGNKITVGDFQSASSADVIVVTVGLFGVPAGSTLWSLNKPILENIFTRVKPKPQAKIIITTTPIDLTAQLVWKLSGLKPKNVIGFGGQLDVNRLKYLIFSDTGDFSTDIEADFIGEHGKRGIPIFRQKVSNREKIIEESKNYFGLFLSEYNASTFGTAKELVKLVETLIFSEKRRLTVSHYDPDHEIFITWPCFINRNGVNEGVDLDLRPVEKSEFEALIKIRKEENAKYELAR